MLDSPIVGRYRLYKEGTARLERWMVHTARPHSALASSLSGPLDHGALTTRNWVQLARVMAAAEVKIPQSILEVFADVIDGREAAARWYGAQSDGSDEVTVANDGRHVHFVGILREVHGILSSSAGAAHCKTVVSDPTASPRNISSPETSQESDTLTNLFEHLQVDEPADFSQDSLRGQLPPPNPSERAKAEDKSMAKENTDDTAFAVWCLLEDLYAIRMYIRGVWTDYTAGKRSIMVAGSLADAGFALMRHANEELINAYGDVGKWYQMLEFLNVCICPFSSWLIVRPRSGTFTIQPRSGSNPADILCAPAGEFLRMIARELERLGKDPEKSPLPRETLEEIYPYHDCGVWFLENLYRSLRAVSALECASGNHRSPDIFRTHDIFIGGLYDYVKSGDQQELPIWIVVACQTHMEIQDIIGGQADVGLRSLTQKLDELALVDHRIDRLFQDKERSRVAFSLTEGSSRLAVIKRRQYLRAAVDGKADVSHAKKPCPRQIWAETLRFLTIAPGAYLRCVALSMQAHAEALINNNLSVLCIAHLYKAADTLSW